MGPRNLKAISDQEEPSKLLRKSSSKGEDSTASLCGGEFVYLYCSGTRKPLIKFKGGLSGLCIFLDSFQGADFNLLHSLEFT